MPQRNLSCFHVLGNYIHVKFLRPCSDDTQGCPKIAGLQGGVILAACSYFPSVATSVLVRAFCVWGNILERSSITYYCSCGTSHWWLFKITINRWKSLQKKTLVCILDCNCILAPPCQFRQNKNPEMAKRFSLVATWGREQHREQASKQHGLNPGVHSSWQSEESSMFSEPALSLKEVCTRLGRFTKNGNNHHHNKNHSLGYSCVC